MKHLEGVLAFGFVAALIFNGGGFLNIFWEVLTSCFPYVF